MTEISGAADAGQSVALLGLRPSKEPSGLKGPVKVAVCKSKVGAAQNDLHGGGMSVRGSDRLGNVRRVDENLGITSYF